MSRIRRYGEFPALYVPDEGEVVRAARSPGGPFLRAVVTKVRRASQDKVRIDFMWLESSPVSAWGTGHKANTAGHVYVGLDDRVPLIRRVPLEPSPGKGEGT